MSPRTTSVEAAWWPPSPIPMATSLGCFTTDERRSGSRARRRDTEHRRLPSMRVVRIRPRLWYRMTTFAQDSKFVCIFQSALKYKTRDAAFGFSDEASLGDGAV